MSSKLKGLIITLLVVLSLVPLNMVYQYLQRRMKPKESFGKFFVFLLVILLLVFGYTFVVVLLIRLLFRSA